MFRLFSNFSYELDVLYLMTILSSEMNRVKITNSMMADALGCPVARFSNLFKEKDWDKADKTSRCV